MIFRYFYIYICRVNKKINIKYMATELSPEMRFYQLIHARAAIRMLAEGITIRHVTISSIRRAIPEIKSKTSKYALKEIEALIEKFKEDHPQFKTNANSTPKNETN